MCPMFANFPSLKKLEFTMSTIFNPKREYAAVRMHLSIMQMQTNQATLTCTDTLTLTHNLFYVLYLCYWKFCCAVWF